MIATCRSESSRRLARRLPALIGHHRGELGGRLLTREVVEDAPAVVRAREGGLGDRPAAASLLSLLPPDLVERLAPGQRDEDVPEVVAIVEPGEAPLRPPRRRSCRRR